MNQFEWQSRPVQPDTGGATSPAPPYAHGPAPQAGAFSPVYGQLPAPSADPAAPGLWPTATFAPAMGAQVYPSYPPPTRSGLPAWAIVLIAIPAVLVVMGILAAIAIPTFLNQRAQGQDSYSFPDSVGGLVHVDNAETRAAIEESMVDLPTFLRSRTDNAWYGPDPQTPTVFVRTIDTVILSNNLTKELDLTIETLERDLGETLTVVDIDPGQRGDLARCGTSAANVLSFCAVVSTEGIVLLLDTTGVGETGYPSLVTISDGVTLPK